MKLFTKYTPCARYYLSMLNLELARIYLLGAKDRRYTLADHLEAAAQWVCRAQDVAGDGGVARNYSFVYNPYFKRKGWFPSYPETTGYIIPTFFDYAKITGKEEIFDRAVRMAEWESRIQLENGAVQGGTIADQPTPAVFNTGQVIFGWIRAYQETGREQFIDSALRAGKFLIKNQEKDGSWRKNLSEFTSKIIPFYNYNTRSAWALYLLGDKTSNGVFTDAALMNIDFALEHQHENGYFDNNCLNKPDQPLLHTIAYCIEGILEVGIISGKRDYIERATKASDGLLPNIRNDGSLAGRFDSAWNPKVNWSCLTGDAQISGIYGRLFQVTQDRKYLQALKKINAYLMKKQIICFSNTNIHGGICGSDPIHGGYGRFEILNWAVKFFMDALMLEQKINKE